MSEHIVRRIEELERCLATKDRLMADVIAGQWDAINKASKDLRSKGFGKPCITCENRNVGPVVCRKCLDAIIKAAYEHLTCESVQIPMSVALRVCELRKGSRDKTTYTAPTLEFDGANEREACDECEHSDDDIPDGDECETCTVSPSNFKPKP